jgi:hypothetical protein
MSMVMGEKFVPKTRPALAAVREPVYPAEQLGFKTVISVD